VAHKRMIIACFYSDCKGLLLCLLGCYVLLHDLPSSALLLPYVAEKKER
jgi:hypothetical protein